MSWQDDLPPIPADRIRRDAVVEGERRRARLRRRRQSVLIGAIAAAAVAVVVGALVTDRPPEDADDSGLVSTAPATTIVPRTEPTEDTALATSPAETEAAGTSAAATTCADCASATTEPSSATTVEAIPNTSVPGPDATLPTHPDLRVEPSVIWEQAAGGPACGPTTVEVTLRRVLTELTPVVHWEVGGTVGEAVMTTDGVIARATVGPFSADVLPAGTNHELLVWTSERAEGNTGRSIRAAPIVLRDCSP